MSMSLAADIAQTAITHNVVDPERKSVFICDGCGYKLDAILVFKKKFHRNRSKANCPVCGKHYIFHNMPPAKGTGAYLLTLKLMEKVVSKCTMNVITNPEKKVLFLNQ